MIVVAYQFSVPYALDEAINLLIDAAYRCGAKVKTLSPTSFEFGIAPWSGAIRIKHSTYLAETNGVTVVRIRATGTDTKSLYHKIWDRYLTTLENISDKELPIVSGTPYIVRTSQIGGGIEHESVGSGISVGGAIAGSLLFGDLGAVAGAYSGAKRNTREVLSDRAIFLLQYSNGLVEEMEIMKNSKLYAEVVSKLNADFKVIHKPKLSAEEIAHSNVAEKRHSKITVFLRLLLLFFCIELILLVSILFLPDPLATVDFLLIFFIAPITFIVLIIKTLVKKGP